MKNVEIGKMVLITPDMRVDENDPRYADEVHIVPVKVDKNDPTWLTFGIHDFVRDCYCHPKVEEQCLGRTIVTHSATVN
jgi:hypothetical protein